MPENILNIVHSYQDLYEIYESENNTSGMMMVHACAESLRLIFDPYYSRADNSETTGSILNSNSSPVWPVGNNEGTITAGYPTYPSGGKHDGIDIAATTGTPVKSVYEGTVVISTGLTNPDGTYRSYGNYVVVESDLNGNATRIYYCHMDSRKVFVGENVFAGQTIGYVGSTGRSSGPHLHFEVRINGVVVDPNPYLPER